MCGNDNVTAAQSRCDRGRAADGRDGSVPCQQRSYGPTAAGKEKIDIEPVLAEKPRLLGHPTGRLGSAYRGINDIELGGACAGWNHREPKNEEESRGAFLMEEFYPQGQQFILYDSWASRAAGGVGFESLQSFE